MRYSFPETWNEYPRLPWIHYKAMSGGGFVVKDVRDGKEFFATEMRGVHEFAADHSQGLGTVIHRATKALGVPRCAPCAQRQATLNGMFRKR